MMRKGRVMTRYVYTFIYFLFLSIYMNQKGKINNWALQFLKNETKTFLDLQNIFYSL